MKNGDRARVIATDEVGTIYRVDEVDGRRQYWLDFELAYRDGVVTVTPGEPITPDGPYDEDQLAPWY